MKYRVPGRHNPLGIIFRDDEVFLSLECLRNTTTNVCIFVKFKKIPFNLIIFNNFEDSHCEVTSFENFDVSTFYFRVHRNYIIFFFTET